MNLAIVPLSIHFNDEVFDEGLPDTYSAFFTRLEASKTIPTTSQPSVGYFFDVFKKALDEGKQVIAILLSSALSGTVSSAQMAAELAGNTGITVIDSVNAASNLKTLVKMALGSRRGRRKPRANQQHDCRPDANDVRSPHGGRPHLPQTRRQA